jgi:cytochrome c-type biogenesis protein CcmH
MARDRTSSVFRGLCIAVLGGVLLLAPMSAHAVAPDEILADPVLEARARALSAGLRCLVCQNQSIDDSEAPLARDLRLLVRERLQAGDSDAAVEAFVVARYGEYVLLRPPLSWHTLVLWLLPLGLLLAAAAVAAKGARAMRQARSSSGVADLTGDEERKLAAALSESEQERKS